MDCSMPGFSVHRQVPALARTQAHRVSDAVVATRSGKQAHSAGQCRQWSALHYTGGPKAESPLRQGPRPVFVKTLYTLSVLAQTHLPKFLETSLDKVKERYDQS